MFLEGRRAGSGERPDRVWSLERRAADHEPSILYHVLVKRARWRVIVIESTFHTRK